MVGHQWNKTHKTSEHKRGAGKTKNKPTGASSNGEQQHQGNTAFYDTGFGADSDFLLAWLRLLIMPILSLLITQVIITSTIFNPRHVPWIQHPPPIPKLVMLQHWFIQEWNKGIHGTVKCIWNHQGHTSPYIDRSPHIHNIDHQPNISSTTRYKG
jgi:hypothetical protein